MKVTIVKRSGKGYKPAGETQAVIGMKLLMGGTIADVKKTVITDSAGKTYTKPSAVLVEESEAKRFISKASVPQERPEASPDNQTTDPATKRPIGANLSKRNLWNHELAVEVDMARLRFDPEGDIIAAYGAEEIAAGKPVPQPFLHDYADGEVAPYTYVGGGKAYRLWPKAAWPGPMPRVYREKDGRDFLGVLVDFDGKEFVLGGPILMITPDRNTISPRARAALEAAEAANK